MYKVQYDFELICRMEAQENAIRKAKQEWRKKHPCKINLGLCVQN